MLTISKQQVQQLDSSLDRQLVSRVVEFLSQQLPEAAAGLERKAIEERVRADIQVARSRGIQRDADLAKWCFIAFICGPRFHESEDIHGLLEEPLMTADAKMDFLMRSLAHSISKMERKD